MDQTLATKFLALLTYARQTNLSLQKGCQIANILDLFRLPLSRAVYDEYVVFSQLLNDQDNISDQKNTWTFIWGTLYFLGKFYKLQNTHPSEAIEIDLEIQTVPKI